MRQLCYTPNHKIRAVNLVKKGMTVSAAADAMGVSKQSLYNWIKLYNQGYLKKILLAPMMNN